jgi:hypothetical protein
MLFTVEIVLNTAESIMFKSEMFFGSIFHIDALVIAMFMAA